MTGKIFLKLTGAVFCLLLLALGTVDYFATEVAKSAHIENLTEQLAAKARMADAALQATPGDRGAAVKRLAQAAHGRITLVAQDGRVLEDSEAEAAAMENHRKRPEVANALAGRAGSGIRGSTTLGVPFLYVAVPVADGALRVAVPLEKVNQQVSEMRWKMLASTGLAFLPAILIAAVLARLISRRLAAIMAHAGELARGNFRARLAGAGNSEFAQLERTLNETAANLQGTVEQLQREHAELEKLERIRKDFVSNVSHELRTPLASIQGYTETLLDGAIHDEEHNTRFLGIIRHNAERLARLTADLLSLSRIEQKRQKFEFQPHRAGALIEDAVLVMRPIAEKKQVLLAGEPVAGTLEVWCDSEAVSQILSNLMDNAIKYTPAGGSVTVGAHRLDGDMVEMFVHDTGVGIPAEELPRLFERFYRVDKARSRELGGTGLGLSIVKHLVAAHRGTTRVESEMHRGSTFYFTLPVDGTGLADDAGELHNGFTAP